MIKRIETSVGGPQYYHVQTFCRDKLGIGDESLYNRILETARKMDEYPPGLTENLKVLSQIGFNCEFVEACAMQGTRLIEKEIAR